MATFSTLEPNLLADAQARELASTIRHLARLGWASGTGGNFSAVQSHDPLRLQITPSGIDKRLTRAAQLLLIDSEGTVLEGAGASSAETRLHLAIVQQTGAGSVLHTHSIWNTLLSRHYATEGELRLTGYEMLKGLRGVKTHTHEECVPILPNSQDMAALSGEVSATLTRLPTIHGFLLAGHGLYTWGDSIVEARRHVEIFEFLFEAAARERLRDVR